MSKGKALCNIIIFQPRVQKFQIRVFIQPTQDLKAFQVADMSFLKFPEGNVVDDRCFVKFECYELWRGVCVRGPPVKVRILTQR